MYIRRLEDSDYVMVQRVLMKESVENIEILGFAKTYGISDGMAEFHGVFEEDELKGIILHLAPAFVKYYALHLTDYELVAEFIDGLVWKELIGKMGVVKPLLEYIEYLETTNSYLAVAKGYEYFELDESTVSIMTTEEELEEVLTLYGVIDEFKDTLTIEKDKLMKIYSKMFLETGAGMKTYMREEGAMIAVAGACMENDEVALLEGVATHPDKRKRGYASIVCMKLMNEYKSKGKKLCLSYTNPKAGSIYRRLGFVEESVGLVVHR